MLEFPTRNLCSTLLSSISRGSTRAAAAVLGVMFALGAVPADAVPPRGGETGQRDVIVEAEGICGFPLYPPFAALPLPPVDPTSPQDIADYQTAVQAYACTLLWYTDGDQDGSDGVCPAEYDGNGILTYKLRNCDKNEDAQRRKAASAVLSLSDCIQKGKAKQVEATAGYLDEYSDKYMLLELAGKLTSTMDLGGDAQTLAADLRDLGGDMLCLVDPLGLFGVPAGATESTTATATSETSTSTTDTTTTTDTTDSTAPTTTADPTSTSTTGL